LERFERAAHLDNRNAPYRRLRDADADVPAQIKKYLFSGFYPRKADGLFGDFEVCALEPSVPGHMQHVRLKATKNLVFRGRAFGSGSE
jgi:hypothetical protein